MAAVPEIKEIHAGQQTNITKKSNNSKPFGTDLILEQADALLKNTGQYARWQQIRQNNDRAALWLGKRLLERHALVENLQKGQVADQETFDRLTGQLKEAGIHLYNLKQLQASAQQKGVAATSLKAAPSSAQKTLRSPVEKTFLPSASSIAPARVSAIFPAITPVSPQGRSEPSPLSFPQSSPTPIAGSVFSEQVRTNVQPVSDNLKARNPALPAMEKAPLQPTDISASVTTASPQAVSSLKTIVSPTILDEENLLILDLKCPEIGLQDTVFGYADDNTVMLPLSSVLQGLDFNISVDPDKGKATGWFISEERSFLLDVPKQQVVINGTSIPFAPGSVMSGEDDIYVSAKNMSFWFPVDFDISRSELTATLVPREKLPQQERLEREQRRLGISSSDIPLKHPVRPLEYDFLSFPVVDINLSGGAGTKGLENTYLNGRYSILAQGDLAYMTSHIFASGYEDSPTDTARIRLERVDPDANLLGPLHATQAAVGDILPATFPILTNVSPERGVFLSNEDLLRSIDYDTTRFEGNLQPGWEVELYRNGALLRGDVVGGDGRYFFDDVPLYFGKNNFVVKAYGPQGQEKILHEKSFSIGSEMLPPGDSLYRISASQRDKTILGLEERNSREEDNSGRFTGQYKYGLTKNLSLGTGLSSVAFGDERHNYLQAGISGSTSFFYGEADYLYDTATGGSGLSLLGQTAVGPVNIKASHEFFSDFVMESRPVSTLEARTRLDIDGNVAATALAPPFSYTFSAENTQYTDYNTGSFSNRLSTRLRDVYLSNYLVLQYGSNSEGNPFDGQFQATGNVGPVRVVGTMKYRLGSDTKVTRYGISSQWQVGENLRTGLDVFQDTDYYNRTTASAKLDWDAGVAMISPRVSVDSDGKFGSFLTLSFSFGKDPGADWAMSSEPAATRGNISTLVYHDLNNNQLFDEGDTPLPDVAVQAIQVRKDGVTDENGHALVSSLQPYRPTDVEVNEDTLEDPFWMPSAEGVAVLPRPGHFERVEIPIVTGGEIDGTVYFMDKNGVNQPLSNVLLEIVAPEGEVAKTIRSEYDGFYLFEKVLPGTYTLRVSSEDDRHASLAAGIEVPITIGNDGTIVSGTDIMLREPVELIQQDIREDNSEANIAGITGAGQPVADIQSVSTVAEQSGEPVRLWPDPIDYQVAPTGVVDGTVYVRNSNGEQQVLAGVDLELVNEQGETVQTVSSGDNGSYVFEELLPGTYTVQVGSKNEQYAALNGGVIQSFLIGNDPTVVREANFVFQESGARSQPVVADATTSERHRVPPIDSMTIQPLTIVESDEAVVAVNIAGQEVAFDEPQVLVADVPELARRELSPASIPAVFPVVEYALEERQSRKYTSVMDRDTSASRSAISDFSVIPQPITPFTPIELAEVEPVRRVNPYASQQVDIQKSTTRLGKEARWIG